MNFFSNKNSSYRELNIHVLLENVCFLMSGERGGKLENFFVGVQLCVALQISLKLPR